MGTVNFTGYSQGSGTDADAPVVGSVGTGKPWGINDRLYVKKSTVDTSKTGITNTNADVYEAIYIPAGTVVMTAWFKVITAESTNVTATFQLGITGTDTDEYVAVTTCATAGEVMGPDGDIIGLGGTLFESADTLDLLVATAAFTDCVVEVYALCLDLN